MASKPPSNSKTVTKKVVIVDKVVSKDQAWWKDGIQFECQGSGKCCVSHDQYGFVYLTDSDRKNMAKLLKLKLTDFEVQYCDVTDGFYHLKQIPDPACMFLKDKRCTVYEARPTQCRTWPFWPEVMNAKTWKKEVSAFCPGVGKGKVWSADEIQKILDEQSKSENET